VTLTYAQSLDGSIAAKPGAPLALSGSASATFTHQLRANHDAILVGVETILSDDPRLNVRLVAGPDPRPIILDSTLRCPLNARCLNPLRRPIIATTDRASLDRERELEAHGVRVMRVPECETRVDLAALLDRLEAEGIRTLMVEGGARVITSFLRAQLVDRLVVTIAPTLVGGVRAVNQLSASNAFPRLRNTTLQQLGEDWIVSGEIDWGVA
jgi:3,4-dihydroxy 2-butanone 4-phosphate synthase/GTP cyclohydrolase II